MRLTVVAAFLVAAAAQPFPFQRNRPSSRFFDPDRVFFLPGQTFQTNFRQFSGYLNATVGSKRNHHFYWFVESQSDPQNDPVVLWLNGGPGCSSLTGFLEELGPFRARKNGQTLFENVYAWNKVANMVFMESPAGVGFSYNEDGNNTIGDDEVAEHNFAALVDFFNKHPALTNNDFYISGESYGGIYLPTLARELIRNNDTFPGRFKGMLIGNGMLSYRLQQQSLIYLQYYRGVIGYEDWDELNLLCCAGENETEAADATTCDWTTSLKINNLAFESDGTACGNKTFEISATMLDTAQNDAYNQYRDCYNPTGGRAARYEQTVRFNYPRYPWQRRRNNNNRRGGNSRFGGGGWPWPWPRPEPQQWYPWWWLGDQDNINYDSTDPLGGFPCWMDNATMTFLDNPRTRRAIHVRTDQAPTSWVTCNPTFEQGDYTREYMDMENVFEYILNSSDIRILVYNGDVDSVCNFLGDEWFVRKVAEDNALEVVEKRHKWVYRGRIAGYVKKFDRIDLLTVKGAGHFVPTDRAGPALQMFANFLANNSYDTPVKQDTGEDQLTVRHHPWNVPGLPVGLWWRWRTSPQLVQLMQQPVVVKASTSTSAIAVSISVVALVAIAVVALVFKSRSNRSGYAKL